MSQDVRTVHNHRNRATFGLFTEEIKRRGSEIDIGGNQPLLTISDGESLGKRRLVVEFASHFASCFRMPNPVQSVRIIARIHPTIGHPDRSEEGE